MDKHSQNHLMKQIQADLNIYKLILIYNFIRPHTYLINW